MYKTTGERIKKLRSEQGLTIAELASIVNLSSPAISNYERNLRKPDSETIIKLSGFFNCSADYLLGLSDYKNKEDKTNSEKKFKKLIDTLKKDEDFCDYIIKLSNAYDSFEMDVNDDCCLNTFLSLVNSFSETLNFLSVVYELGTFPSKLNNTQTLCSTINELYIQKECSITYLDSLFGEVLYHFHYRNKLPGKNFNYFQSVLEMLECYQLFGKTDKETAKKYYIEIKKYEDIINDLNIFAD